MTKNIYFIISISFAGLAVLFFVFWFWGRYLFVDEFFTVTVTSDSNGVQIENEEKLTPEYVHKATSVLGQWRNMGSVSCDVRVNSDSVRESFLLEPQESFGLLLPKGEAVKFTFCDEEGVVDLRKL